MSDGEFRRAMLNQPTIADDRLIGVQVWDNASSARHVPEAPFVFAVEINPERTWASVVVAGANGVIELIEHRQGISWLLECLEKLRQHGEMRLVIDDYGPAAAYIPDIVAAGIKVIPYKHRDVAMASTKFYDDLYADKVKVRSHPDLDEAAAAVHKKPTGDSWVFARASAADVSPLIAAVLAYDQAAKPQFEDLWLQF